MQTTCRIDSLFTNVPLETYRIRHAMRLKYCVLKGIPLSTIYRNNLDDPGPDTDTFHKLVAEIMKRRKFYLITRRYRKEQANAFRS